MHACIALSGHQYTVQEGDLIEVFHLPAAGAGSRIEVVPLALVAGADVITDREQLAAARVVCEIVEVKKGPKILSFRKVHKTGFRKCRGHRDVLTVVRVEKISAPGA